MRTDELDLTVVRDHIRCRKPFACKVPWLHNKHKHNSADSSWSIHHGARHQSRGAKSSSKNRIMVTSIATLTTFQTCGSIFGNAPPAVLRLASTHGICRHPHKCKSFLSPTNEKAKLGQQPMEHCTTTTPATQG